MAMLSKIVCLLCTTHVIFYFARINNLCHFPSNKLLFGEIFAWKTLNFSFYYEVLYGDYGMGKLGHFCGSRKMAFTLGIVESLLEWHICPQQETFYWQIFLYVCMRVYDRFTIKSCANHVFMFYGYSIFKHSSPKLKLAKNFLRKVI